MNAADLRRRLYVVLALRWLPIGLTGPVLVLLQLDRGLTLAEVGMVIAVQGVTVFVLELPTGGLADALGRRPVLATAGALHVATLAVMLVADTVWLFALAWLLSGIFRALDSGPLEAWYVDAAQELDDGVDLERDLAGAGVVIGTSIAVGSVVAGLLPLLDETMGLSAPLAMPVAAALVVAACQFVAVLLLVREVRPAVGVAAVRATVAGTGRVIANSVRMARSSRALLALFAVELLWGVGLAGVELLWQPRFADLSGGTDNTVVFGFALAAAWGTGAAGAALVPLLTRMFRGDPRFVGFALRIAQGVGVGVMALAGHIVLAVSLFLFVFAVHGAANPVHQALLHRNTKASERATTLSINSLSAQTGGVAGSVALGAFAQWFGIPFAWGLAAVVLAAAAPLYLMLRPSPAGAPGRAPASAPSAPLPSITAPGAATNPGSDVDATPTSGYDHRAKHSKMRSDRS